MMRTSETDPLLIDELAYPEGPGRIGLTFCPGKRQSAGRSGHWSRDLGRDLDMIRDWSASTVVTLIEDHEFSLLQVERLPDEVRARGMTWLHFPIIDCSAPDKRFLEAWREEGPRLHQRLAGGENVLIHCMGGLGRTGTVAAQLLIEANIDAREAIRQVRTARPFAIETGSQTAYLHRLAERGELNSGVASKGDHGASRK